MPAPERLSMRPPAPGVSRIAIASSAVTRTLRTRLLPPGAEQRSPILETESRFGPAWRRALDRVPRQREFFRRSDAGPPTCPRNSCRSALQRPRSVPPATLFIDAPKTAVAQSRPVTRTGAPLGVTLAKTDACTGAAAVSRWAPQTQQDSISHSLHQPQVRQCHSRRCPLSKICRPFSE